jgi:haloalkane dehalogenase
MISVVPAEASSKEVTVRGTPLHYLDAGVGDPVLFIHGNPTSSVLWRNVIGPVARSGRRCLALDLVGMGQSGKPDIEYRLSDHIAYVDGFVQALALTDLTMVGHDWGAVIALDHARRFPGRVKGVAFLEGHIHPIDHWGDLDEGGREMFRRLRSPGLGEQLVIEENFFIETVLPAGMLRIPSEEEMEVYRAPYREPASRQPILRWIREIPIEGSPADVIDVVEANQGVIADPAMPTLLLHATPGAVITEPEVAWCRDHGAALTVIDIGPGTHFLPEDRPEQIAANLCRWLDELG